MSLPPYSERLLDDARSERKRLGGSDLSVPHLAAVICRRRPDAAGILGGSEQLRALVAHRDLVGEDRVVSLLEEAQVHSADELDGLVASLDRAIAAARESSAPIPPPVGAETAAATGADDADEGVPEQVGDTPLSSTGSDSSWLDGVGGFLEPVEVLGREELVDEIVERIGRERTAITPLLVGHPGSGRSTVLQALATRLAGESYDGPLAGHRVFVLRAHALAERSPAGTLRNVARELGPDAILCIDDLEVAAGFSRVSADLDFLQAVRTLVAEQRPRIVITVDDGFASQLAAVANELDEELELLPVPVLSPAEREAVVRQESTHLGAAHGVEIPVEIQDLALGPALTQKELAQPGLALARLDRACVRCRLDGRTVLTEDDLGVGPGSRTGPLVVDGLVASLTGRVMGQDAAVRRIGERLALTRAGLDLRPHRPDGVFLLVGPTGVGKTELAKALADEVFGGSDALIRLDMSEYAQEWALSQITGPPPGYVGSTDPGSWLTTKVLARPDSLILLDEFEKAHHRIWNTFLQVFDDGRLTDSMGRTVDFSRTVFILTSNLGAQEAARTPVGFSRGGDSSEEFDARMQDAARDTLAPELLNRLDDVVVFHALGPAVIRAIARQNIDQLSDRYRLRGFSLSVPDDVVDHVATSGYDPRYGARHLQRNIEQLLLEPLVGLEGHHFLASLDGDAVRWTATA